MTERIVNLALEIIYLLTGEECTPVKKPSGDYVNPNIHPNILGVRSNTPSLITEPTSLSRINERSNIEKILDLTSKIIELLTGEVPVRCQDVTIHFSTEEWEYIEEHKDLYKDIIMKDHQPLTSLDVCSKTCPPEKCPSSSYAQGWPVGDRNVPQDHQVEDLTDIRIEVKEVEEETYVMGDQLCKATLEESSLGYGTEDSYITKYISGHHITPQISPAYYINEPPFDPYYHKESSLDLSQSVNQSADHSKAAMRSKPEYGKGFQKNRSKLPKVYNDDRPYSCPYCGKRFTTNSGFLKHQRSHGGGKSYSCSKRGKNVTRKSSLFENQVIHPVEKPFTCTECGKYFTKKIALNKHKKIHAGKEPFSCPECFKTFVHKSSLVDHQRIHTGEKPFQCSECGRRFTQRSGLINHQKIHTMEKPYSCMDCGKSFKRKDNLERHQKIHRGEKPFSCSECGRFFIQRSDLFKHHRIHTREKLSSCLTLRENVVPKDPMTYTNPVLLSF